MKKYTIAEVVDMIEWVDDSNNECISAQWTENARNESSIARDDETNRWLLIDDSKKSIRCSVFIGNEEIVNETPTNEAVSILVYDFKRHINIPYEDIREEINRALVELKNIKELQSTYMSKPIAREVVDVHNVYDL